MARGARNALSGVGGGARRVAAALITAVLEQGSRPGILGADYDSSRREWSDFFTALFGARWTRTSNRRWRRFVAAAKAGDGRRRRRRRRAAGDPAGGLDLPRDLLRACVPHCSAEQREVIRNRIQACQ